MVQRLAPRGGAGLGVRVHLALLALLALLPAWGAAGFVAWRFAEAERTRVVQAGKDAARDIAAAVEREVAALEARLQGLAASPALTAARPERLAAQSALMEAPAGVELRQVPRDGREDAARRISGLHREPGSGRRVVTFRLPIRAASAAPAGAALVLTTDALSLWSPILDRARLPSGWVAAVLDGDRTILARTPEAERFVGQPVHPDALAALEAGHGATAGWRTGLTRDGRPVHIAWREIEGLPWTVLIGVPRDAVDGALWRALLPVGLAGLPVLLGVTFGVAAWGARRFARPLRRLEAAATAVGQGEVPAPLPASGVREIDAVGIALVAAAAGRRERQAESAALAARLQTLLESTTDGVATLDRDWRLTYLNGPARALLGPGGGEPVGMPFLDCLPEDARAALAAGLRHAQQGGLPTSVTAACGPGGPWLAVNLFPFPGGLTVFLRDVTAERLAEQALRESEARLQAVLDHVPVGVLMLEAPSGRIILSNRRLADMLGERALRPDRVIDFARAPVFRAEDAAAAVAESCRPLARALRGEATAGGDYRFRRRDGGHIWLRVRAVPIRDASGRVVRAVAALMEIDAERRAAEALRQSELRFRTLAEAVPQIVWSSGPDGVLDYVNQRYFEFTGLPSRDPPASADIPLHPDDRDRARAAWRAALAEGAPYEAEHRMRRADGAWRWLVARAVPARGADGTIHRWIGSAADVTELVETRQALERQVAAEAAARQAAVAAAEALAASETRFRRFAGASPDALWILDVARDRLEFASPAFATLWGAPPGPGAGHATLVAGVLAQDAEAAGAALGRIRAGATVEAEYRIRRGDGEVRWLRLLGFPLGLAPGAAEGPRPALVAGFLRDISARKEAEDRQRLLIAELNHRVKNTLATVLSLARQTARRTRTGAPGEADAAEAGGATVERFLKDFQDRLIALACGHDLLTARSWQGALLAEVAEAALAPWRGASPAVARREIAASRILSDGPAVWLAPRQALGLALAFHEMVTNAAKHGALGAGAAGQVSLTWQVSPEGLVALDWVETGGPPAMPPAREGFGTRLLRTGLPMELGPDAIVTLDHRPEGFRAHIRFRPAPEGEAT